MKLVKETGKNNKKFIVKTYLAKLEKYAVLAYLFCMLGIFPLYYRDQYSKIGTAKFELFWYASLCFIGVSTVFVLAKLLLKQMSQISDLDYAVFIYAICVVLSFAFSDFKDYGYKGAAGWEMGLCSQLIFVVIYFILSGKREWCSNAKSQRITGTYSLFAKTVLAIHLISSAFAFLLGILHRFEIDPLGMYEGLNLNQKIEFLSTIGQATWFSSYVCTVFAVGVTIFYISSATWVRMVTGIYTVISFGILVTQNSDSAFIAIVGILLLLGYYSSSEIKKWCRFLQIICMMWGTFAGIGLLQKVFAHRAIPLDSLSIFFSQSIVTWIMFILSLAAMMFYGKYYKKQLALTGKKKGKNEDLAADRIMEITKKGYKIVLFCFVAAVIGIIIFIYLNTKGYLLNWFGYRNINQYLLFDYHWGNNRGSTWSIVWQAFVQMPFYQKLFGVGPDSLSEYLYNVPQISDLLHSLWGNTRLTNAHNEYLNSLLCYGVVGLTAWLTVLIGGISYFYKKAKENPFMIAFALCIMGYVCHNIFCYQQVCCTPFLFIALGIGESLTKSENFNTIK